MTAHLTMALLASTVAMTAPTPRRVDWLPRFTVASVKYWGNGQLPACGPIAYAWSRATDPTENAHADPAACVVTFNSAKWPEFVAHPAWECILVAHEVGHLFGHRHEEGGVMSPDTDKYLNAQSFPPCHGVPA